MCIHKTHPHRPILALREPSQPRGKIHVSNTTHTAKAVSSTPELLRTEKQHIWKVLTNCKYSSWALDWIEYKNVQESKPKSAWNNNSNNHNKIYMGIIVLLYVQGLCKRIEGMCGSMTSTHTSWVTEQSRTYLYCQMKKSQYSANVV